MERAIISMTVIPSRLDTCGPVIESLKKQGLPVYVWIQEEVKRTGAVFNGHFPDFLAGTTATVVKERGPITKLLPGLVLGEIVITADDDVIYGDGWADGLLAWHERLPSAVLGYRGRVFTDREYNNTAMALRVSKPTNVDILTSTWGALYRSDWLDESIYEEWQLWPMNDDLVVNAHLKRLGIPRVVVPMDCQITPVEKLSTIDSLWSVNRHQNDQGLDAVGWWE